MFRDNCHSLGHAFSKAIEIPRSEKIEGCEERFPDVFPASDQKKELCGFKVDDVKRFFFPDTKMTFFEFWTSQHKSASNSSDIGSTGMWGFLAYFTKKTKNMFLVRSRFKMLLKVPKPV